jgi:hypothetical protein
MSTERLHLPVRPALDIFRRHSAWAAVSALAAMLHRLLEAFRRRTVEPDTSIAWEDGEAANDRETRG